MKTITTHQSVDLDACVSIFLVRETLKPEETKILFGGNEGNIFVDYTPLEVPAGAEIYDHHSAINSKYVSAADMIWNKGKRSVMQSEYWPLVWEASMQDCGMNFRMPQDYRRLGLADILAGLKTAGGSDLEIYQDMEIIFHCLVNLTKKRHDAVDEFRDSNGRIEGRIAIAYSPSPGVGAWLFESQGVDLMIFADGNNLGVQRNATIDEPDLNLLKGFIETMTGEEGWFYHPKGFLVARGTRKHPADTPSEVTPEDLLGMLQKITEKEEVTA